MPSKSVTSFHIVAAQHLPVLIVRYLHHKYLARIQARGTIFESESFYNDVFLEVKNFQPYYTFHHRHFEELQIGSTILKEYLAIESEKEERIALAKKNEKAAHDAIAEKVSSISF